MSDTKSISSIADISDTTDSVELIYDTDAVSNILGVQSSTLRKYCSLMQKYGYEFNKNSVGHRIFYSKDIKVIKEIVVLKNSGSLTLAQAVQTILNADIADIDDIESISGQRYDQLLGQFEDFRKEQMQFNKMLLKQLEKQEEYIENSINKRDRKLLESIKESMETRAAIAEKQRKRWWQFWK